MIVTKNLIKYYENGLVKALNGVSLSVPKGKSVTIMGPSGCGKTTLLNLIGTIDKPTKGEIFVDRININSIKQVHKFRNSKIGFIFQFHNLIPNLSLLENIALPAYPNKNMNNKQRSEAAYKLLDELGIANKAKYTPPFISGGQRQLAAVARSLINSPKIILADEPTGNVDTENAQIIMQMLINKCKKENITLLLVTHNGKIAELTEKIYYMQDGRLVT